MEQEEVVVEETVSDNEGIEPFDWEDHLYESWLEEKWKQERKGLMTLASQSKRWSKLEHEPSFQSKASRCSPRTGTDSGSGISTLFTSEYAQEMPSSLSAPVSDLDPPDVKDGQRR
jgi:hypothetical protein